MNRPWLSQYPAGVPADIDPSSVGSLVDMMDAAFRLHRERPALVFMGRTLRFGELDRLSAALAAWLSGQGLERGDRVAVMLPNVPQFAVAVAAILRAGLVVVPVNPLYTPRELEHQLKDAGVRVVFVLENFAATLAQALPALPALQRVVTCTMGDLLGWPKGALVNLVVRHVKKLVPAYRLASALPFPEALSRGAQLKLARPAVGPDDIAVLQYTGGTTGLSKGAVLLHRNLVANVLQSEAWYQPALSRIPAGEQIVTVCALPLFHIFGFTAILLLGLRMGSCALLIPNPRDVGALLAELARHRFHSFPAVNTLFNAVLHHPDAAKVDWSGLKISIGGGMAVQQATARAWLERTGCPICEGYGLSETSPSAVCNPVDTAAFSGTIGVPLPSTEVRILDDAGGEVAAGTPGEIAIRGPQVMAGYWQRPDETARAMTADGFLRTGDIGVMDEQGRVRIVDRKKDMILVSGFNVYPNEIEDVVTQLPGVLEAAAVGVPDAASGEVVKLFVVRKDPALTEAAVRNWCETQLTGYKRPRAIEFRTELPKTTVGKILRRELKT